MPEGCQHSGNAVTAADDVDRRQDRVGGDDGCPRNPRDCHRASAGATAVVAPIAFQQRGRRHHDDEQPGDARQDGEAGAHADEDGSARGRLPSGVQHRQRGEQCREGRGDVDAVEVTEPDDERVEQPEQRGEHARRGAEQPAGEERDQHTGRGRFEDRHDARGEQVRLQPAICGVMTDELLAHRVPASRCHASHSGCTAFGTAREPQRAPCRAVGVAARRVQIVAGERGQAGGDLRAFVVGRTVGPRLVQREHQEERGRHAEAARPPGA